MENSGDLESSASDSKPSSTLISDVCLHVEPTDVVSFALHRLDRIESSLPIYIDASAPSNYISAGQARVKVLQVAKGLQTYGLRKGECVCIHSSNNIWYPLLWLGIIAAGGIVTGSNPAYTSAELIHHLTVTETRYIIAHVDKLAAVEEAVEVCGILDRNVFVLGAEAIPVNHNHNHFTCWRVLLECGHDEWKQNIHSEQDQHDEIVAYAPTSGTTGRPKAAQLSHAYWVAQGTTLEYIFLQRKHAVRQLLCLPIFHAFAAQLAIVLPLRLGIPTYFMTRFALDPYLRFCQNFRITDTAVVPPIIGSLLAGGSAEALQSLRYIICAGAPIRSTVQTRLYSLLHPSATISQCWGATELGWVSLFEERERDCSGSVGRLLPNTVLKIVDDNGNTVSRDRAHGEANVSSLSMMRGYHKNIPATEASFDSLGFYRTGDRVYVENGKVFIIGRIKDVMKVNGWQVNPEELETVIMQLDGVLDCAVVARIVTNDQEIEDTQPQALVVRNPASQVMISSTQIQNHVLKSLVSYKRLSGGVVFVSSIPRSNTGKILRRTLVALEVQDDYNNDLDLTHVKEESNVKAMWKKYAKAVVLVPLCALLGPPGLILLLWGFQKSIETQRRIHQG